MLNDQQEQQQQQQQQPPQPQPQQEQQEQVTTEGSLGWKGFTPWDTKKEAQIYPTRVTSC